MLYADVVLKHEDDSRYYGREIKPGEIEGEAMYVSGRAGGWWGPYGWGKKDTPPESFHPASQESPAQHLLRRAKESGYIRANRSEYDIDDIKRNILENIRQP